MYKLRTKITLSYVIISLVIVGIIGIIANVMLEKIFREYVINALQQKNTEIVSQIADSYNPKTNMWSHEVLDSIGMNALANNLFVKLKDKEDVYVWDAWKHNNGLCTLLLQNMSQNMYKRYPKFNGEYTEKNYDIVVHNTKVGSVDIGYYGPYFYTDSDLKFINSLNVMLAVVVIFSLAIALILGLYISFRLTDPISKVINAANQITNGNLSERVTVKSRTKEIHELISTINNLAETLEAVEGLRKQMTSDIAHELRTPLSTVRSHMEAMIDGIWKPDTARLKSCHEEIMRLNRMVDDLKKLSEFEANNLKLTKTSFDFSELIDRITLNFEAAFVNKGIQFTTNNYYTGAFYGDRDKISQIIVNLLSNALCYTDKGGEVSVTTTQIDENMVITVCDTGIGMLEKELPFIFERFYRTDKSRTKATGGTGIGLTIVKSLVLAHEGTIVVESQLGEGSRFIVKLPLKNFV